MTFNDLIVFVSALGLWILLTRFVFPKLGIPTCCGNSCQIEDFSKKNGEKDV